MLRYFILIILIFKVVNSELCIYDRKGTRKFPYLSTNDIGKVYKKHKNYFIDTFNTYYGDCHNEKNITNIYGITAERILINNNISKSKRNDNESELNKLFNLSSKRSCNLLTGEDAEGNPYSEMLTGIENANIIEGRINIGTTDRAISGKDSISYSYSTTFDDSYSVSVSTSYSTSNSISIEKHSDNSTSTNFSESISKVIEESLSNSRTDDESQTWDSTSGSDITQSIEKNIENNWSKENNKSFTSGVSSSIDNGTNWSQGKTQGSSKTTSKDDTTSQSFEGSISFNFFGVNIGGGGGKQSSTSVTKSEEVNNSVTDEKGGSTTTTTGTSSDQTIGSSDSTGGSSGTSNSISTTESLSKSNGGSRSISNAIERSSSHSETTENSTGIEIGSTIGSSESHEDSVTNSIDKSIEFGKSKSVTLSIEGTINGNGSTCEIAIFKKIKRIYQIASCYDRDNNYNVIKNTRSIITVDVDVNALIRMNEIISNTGSYDEFDPNEPKKVVGQIMASCIEDADKSIFKNEENDFLRAKRILNENNIDFFPALISGTVLKSNKIVISDRASIDNGYAMYGRKLYNDGGNLVYYFGNNLEYNTETENISFYTEFRISDKNHLEGFVNDEIMFQPILPYADEFKSLKESPYPFDIVEPDDPLYGQPLLPNPEDNKDYENQPENPIIQHIINNKLDYPLFVSQSPEDCKILLEYCNALETEDEDRYDEIEMDLIDNNENLYLYINNNDICLDVEENENYLYDYNEEEMNYICGKSEEEMKKLIDIELRKKHTNIISDPTEENDQCDCEVYNKCFNRESDIETMDKIFFYSECEYLKSINCNNKCRKLYSRFDTNDIADLSHFDIKNVIVWSSVRPEHQNLIVGWNGNGEGHEFSYLVVKSYDENSSEDHGGFTLYDPIGIPIWDFDPALPNKSTKLDSNGYYLPVMYGYPFKNEEVTKNIPEKYYNKKYPYLTLPENIKYYGNTLDNGGCKENTLHSNEGLKSANGRFHLILLDSGNLVFKDHNVTIWESRTANLWQGKSPYKLILGNDGNMRILNNFDYVMMSTDKDPEENNVHQYRRYQLQVLNSGTFRIVNEDNEEVWNMWNHAKYNKINLYMEIAFYDSCEGRTRNPNLPLISTQDEESSIIKVGEQLINRFTLDQYKDLTRTEESFNKEVDPDNTNLNSSKDYIFDINNNFYSTACMPLTSFYLKYQNLLKKYEFVDNENKIVNDSFFDLVPITGRNSKIVYGKLTNEGVFNIYDSSDNVLFTTGIKGDDQCTDPEKCFYYMYITPDKDGYITIAERKYDDSKKPYDKLVWRFPPSKKLTEMNSDGNNEYEFLKNNEALIYRQESLDKECVNRNRNKSELEKRNKSNNEENGINNNNNKEEKDQEGNNNNNTNEEKDQDNNNNNNNEEEDQDNNNNCNLINEFACMTLRNKGVYFYGNSEPFFPYNITSESELRLNKESGLLTLDGQEVFNIKNEFAKPTKLKCDIHDDVYGVVLYDKNGVVIWEYPSKLKYCITNKDLNNTMVVDRSVYYRNNNEDIPCLDFKKDGLYNGENKITLDFDNEVEGRTLYMNKTHIYIQDINDQVIPNSIIRLYNPKNHDVKLYCKNDENIVVIDEESRNIVWSYPTQSYTLLSSNTTINQLRPDQQLILKGKAVNQFCLKIEENNLYNIDNESIKFGNDTAYGNIEYLEVTNKGVFIYFEDNNFINLTENIDVSIYENQDTDSTENENNNPDKKNKNKNKRGIENEENEKSIYSIKCEMQYGKLKAKVYYNDNVIMTLPDYEKKYVISSTNFLYYGEKLYNSETDTECLLFDDNKLYTKYDKYEIYAPKTIIKDEDYIKIDKRYLTFNNDVYLRNVTNISSDNILIGKCMEYHGYNKFVLFSLTYNDVLLEFPEVPKRNILKGDDIIYDILYYDANYTLPCIQVKAFNVTNDDGKGETEMVGLFFNKEDKPINNHIIPSKPNNNNLKFNQYEGKLLLNDDNFFIDKTFTKNLYLTCIIEYEGFYAIIKNEEGEEQWRYPDLNMKKYISLEKNSYLLTGEYLYDEKRNEKCLQLAQDGIIFNESYLIKTCNNEYDYSCNSNRRLYLEDRNSQFAIVFSQDNNKLERILINKKIDTTDIKLKCDLKLGLYVSAYDSNNSKDTGKIIYKKKTFSYEKFTTDDTLYIGDKIIYKDKTPCAWIDENANFYIGERLISSNVYEIKLTHSVRPLMVNSINLFSDLENDPTFDFTKNMSLRCEQSGTEIYLALYDDDSNTIIDEILNKCRKNKYYITNEKNNNEICIGYPLYNEHNSYDESCLSYNENFKLVDYNNNILFDNSLFKSKSIYFDINNGNLVTNNKLEETTLLNLNCKKVEIKCNYKNEIEIFDKTSNSNKLLWKHRPSLNECSRGMELKSYNDICKSIYIYEKMGTFEITSIKLGKNYKKDILKLSLSENGELIANDKTVLIKDDWKLNNNYNYVVNCDNGCKFINVNTTEIIQDFNEDFKSTINTSDILFLGNKIMCKNASLVLTNKGLIYRNHKDKTKEYEFKGDTESIEIGNTRKIVKAKFDDNFNFVIYLTDEYAVPIVNYRNEIEENTNSNKIVRMTCENDGLEFYELYKGKKYVYYHYPITTRKIVKTYYAFTLRGTIGSKHYLGVEKLATMSKFKFNEHSVYNTWILDSNSEPSVMYLSNDKNKNTGKKSDYCLGINTTSSKTTTYLSIVNCKDVTVKFRVNYPSSNTIAVFYNNEKSSNKCIYYTDDPYIKDCKNDSNFKWTIKSVGSYNETITEKV